MATLLIEHAISDYQTWRAAFDRFAGARNEAGVTRERVYRPIDDQQYVIITLDFPAPERASSFLQFLQTRIWSNPDNAPALRGAPRTRILEVSHTAG